MRIVQVCPYAWSARGGVQSHVRHLSRALRDRGHEVLVLSAGHVGSRPTDAELETGGRDTSDRPVTVQLVGTSVRVPFNGSIAPICIQPGCGRAVRRALAEFQPDVVHVHEPLVPGVSLAALWFARAPVVATFHAYCPPSLDASLYRLAAQCLRPVSRRVTVRLGVSGAAASCAAARVNGHVNIVPNGITIESFAGARPALLPPGRRILFVGRLDRRKGFEVAMRAFARVCERFADVQLIVVGDGPCRGEVEAAPPAVRDRVVMLGEVGDRELPSLYAAADVFIAPAIGNESFGTVLLEAMAAGRPIVATSIEGYREVVRADIDALVVGPRDAEALADGIGRILCEPALAARLALSARARVQQFSWDVVTNAVERAYGLAVGPGVVNGVLVNVPVVGPL
jgi:phosphatidylinositol alpha-mannosyltransferase